MNSLKVYISYFTNKISVIFKKYFSYKIFAIWEFIIQQNRSIMNQRYKITKSMKSCVMHEINTSETLLWEIY